jgi:predicted RNase H-like nuclease
VVDYPRPRLDPEPVLVAGVDGCRNGWVVATSPLDLSTVEVRVVAAFAEIAGLVAVGPLAAAAVDMPIGLPDDRPRVCDAQARRLIGARRSSVFPAPMRSVLDAADYDEACALSRSACGVALSRQGWGLVAKVAEVDAAMSAHLQDTIVEAHPEGSFTELMGRPPGHSKRTSAGRAERTAALVAVFADWRPRPVPGAASDDVLDAVVLVWTAARLARGEALRLGDGGVDARGLRMEIVR